MIMKLEIKLSWCYETLNYFHIFTVFPALYEQNESLCNMYSTFLILVLLLSLLTINT